MEINESGSLLGYRGMQQKLKIVHGIRISRYALCIIVFFHFHKLYE